MLELDLGEEDAERFCRNLLKRQNTVEMHSAVIIDIDGAPTSARNLLAKALPLTTTPLVLVCTAEPLEEQLVRQCQVLPKLQAPSQARLAGLLRHVAREQGLLPEEGDGSEEAEGGLEALAHSCGGDVRRALNDLQLLSKTVAAREKSQELQRVLPTPEESCRKLLSSSCGAAVGGGGPGVAERLDLAALEADRVAALVHANYLIVEDQACRGSGAAASAAATSLGRWAEAAEAMAESDALLGGSLLADASPGVAFAATLLGAILPGHLAAQAGAQPPRFLSQAGPQGVADATAAAAAAAAPVAATVAAPAAEPAAEAAEVSAAALAFTKAAAFIEGSDGAAA